MKQNILLTDFYQPKDWSFLRVLSRFAERDFELKYDAGSLSRSKIRRIIGWIVFPIKLFCRRKNYEIIVSWQQMFGLFFAFYCRLFRVKKRTKLYIMTFIYKPKKEYVGGMYHKFMTYIVQSKYIDKLIVFSKNEIEYYTKIFGIPEDKFFFTPLTISWEKEPKYDESLRKQKYVFSTGRSNRDYNKLIRVFGEVKYSLHIACDTLDSKLSSTNVRIFTDMFRDDMRHHMYNAHCIAISLDNPNVSSGQLVFLQAMQMKKPIVCTRCPSVEDYLLDGYNALLVNSDEEWKEAIERLYNDFELYETLSANAYKEYIEKYSAEGKAKSIGLMIKEDLK